MFIDLPRNVCCQKTCRKQFVMRYQYNYTDDERTPLAALTELLSESHHGAPRTQNWTAPNWQSVDCGSQLHRS